MSLASPLICERATPAARTAMPAWRRIVRNNWIYALLLTPGFALLLLFFHYPALQAVRYAFYEWNGEQRIFIGLGNFRDLWHDPVFRDSLGNLAILLTASLVIAVAVPVVVAELIFNLRSERWKQIYQVGFLVTGLVPGIVTMLLWQFLYDPYFGPFNALLESLGFGRAHILWLADPHWALASLILIGFPWVGGISVLIMLAGLNNIPTSVLDYARIEGLGLWRRFWNIDVHFLFGQLRLLLITGFIGLVQAFGLQLVLTQGGPGTATMVPSFHMYLCAFSYDRLGYASAMGVVLAAMILVFTLLNFRFLRGTDG